MSSFEGGKKEAFAMAEGNRFPTLSENLFEEYEVLPNLRRRVEELEKENERLKILLKNCSCSKDEVELENGVQNSKHMSRESQEKPVPEQIMPLVTDATGCKSRSIEHCARRYVALKIMYFGQRFFGFASEAQMDPTVESEIFGALKKTKLLVGKKEDAKYSRCGRTDKGVSSTGQVIALYLRSKLKDGGGRGTDVALCEEEIDYVRVLNKVLRKDIRVMGWCPVPTYFHARFSCLSREYKYLFWRRTLDILATQKAADRFIGEHDFRNFCKMDAVNVHNYIRKITAFDISSCNQSNVDDELYSITIKGSAFLWHQVRCMVSVLFLIGEGLESPDVVDELLDINKTPRKPQYTMAPELPLILQSCKFEGLDFYCSPDSTRTLHEHLKNEFHTFKLQAAIFREALDCLLIPEEGSKIVGKKKCHIPLMLRPTEPSYEERRAN